MDGPDPAANGTSRTAPDPRAAGDLYFTPGPEMAASLDDMKYVEEQFNLGTFDEYDGQHIAVVDKKVIAHDADYDVVLARVSDLGVSPVRVYTTYINRSFFSVS